MRRSTALRTSRQRQQRRGVYHVAPGGLRDRAGVGRLVTGLVTAWPEERRAFALRVVDSYGAMGLALAPFYFARACAQLLLDARGGRIDLIHVHASSWGSFLRKGLVAQAASRLRVPVLIHLHGPEFDTFYRGLPQPARRFVSATLGRAACVAVGGESWRRFVVEEIGVSADRVLVLHNAAVGPNAPRDAAWAGAPRLLFLGQLGQRKGLPELLEALGSPALAGLDWTARIVGGGDVSGWRARARRLGLGGRVRFDGWLPESGVREALASSDIFVLPSRAEGHSIAVLEAMAAGLAVVTTPVGGAADTLRDGTTALLVPPGHGDAIGAAIARVIRDPGLRDTLGRNARARFLEAHQMRDFCRRLDALYDQIVTGGGRRHALPKSA